MEKIRIQKKHTKGNWLVEEQSGNKLFVTAKDSEALICAVQPKEDKKEEKANANLLAMAPELVDSLGRCLNMLSMVFEKFESEQNPVPESVLQEFAEDTRVFLKATGSGLGLKVKTKEELKSGTDMRTSPAPKSKYKN